jgi:hypothetical protein
MRPWCTTISAVVPICRDHVSASFSRLADQPAGAGSACCHSMPGKRSAIGSAPRACAASSERQLTSQMRHHLGGKEIHVPPREIVRGYAELEERHENAEAGALAHPLDARQHRFRATDQHGAALDEAFGGGLAAALPVGNRGYCVLVKRRTIIRR